MEDKKDLDISQANYFVVKKLFEDKRGNYDVISFIILTLGQLFEAFGMDRGYNGYTYMDGCRVLSMLNDLARKGLIKYKIEKMKGKGRHDFVVSYGIDCYKECDRVRIDLLDDELLE